MRITSVNRETQNVELQTNCILTKEEYKNKNELIKNRIKEIQLHNTEIGNFNKYFESNSKHYLVYELATYVLNDKLEILSISRNRNLFE